MAAGVDGDVVLGADNPETVKTTITNSTANSNAFEAAAAGTGYGLVGTSTGGAGIVGWSITAPVLDPANTSYLGVYGFSPASPIDATFFGTGVTGESDDVGVFGNGSAGVWGSGTYGVVGDGGSSGAGVLALGQTTTDVALDVRGKVRFSRSGRVSVGAGKSSKIVYLAGTTSS